MDKSNLIVDKPAHNSRVEILLIEEIKRLENDLLKTANDRDRFARMYHDSLVDREALKLQIKELEGRCMPVGRTTLAG